MTKKKLSSKVIDQQRGDASFDNTTGVHHRRHRDRPKNLWLRRHVGVDGIWLAFRWRGCYVFAVHPLTNVAIDQSLRSMSTMLSRYSNIVLAAASGVSSLRRKTSRYFGAFYASKADTSKAATSPVKPVKTPPVIGSSAGNRPACCRLSIASRNSGLNKRRAIMTGARLEARFGAPSASRHVRPWRERLAPA